MGRKDSGTMKIQVMRCDGRTETLTLIGTIRAGEAAPNGQGSLLIESTGTTHFFRAEDGAYDGWGIEVAEIDGGLNKEDMLKFINAVEKDREIHNTGEVA
jgi:hypothetical protein